ncbi:hypothetical protein [Streptomonospora salina]|uniref:Uncharacterized protein n=1 Tax=Streptomonospora salina TaxID=104205 RepID=A0A841E5G1_9ACTN|nr:hypothetical protein [Streptomonospora salina]MBB5996529.1 hypothetical protein [Streptomonospora salina]MBB6000328.1 hypothetical protein [Streptomonospora salina]
MGDLGAEIGRIRDLIEQELRREFPMCDFCQLPRGWWAAWHGELRVMAPNAKALRRELSVVLRQHHCPGENRL